MLYKFPIEKRVKIKKNEQAEEIQKKETGKSYTEEEVIELLRKAQMQGGLENGK